MCKKTRFLFISIGLTWLLSFQVMASSCGSHQSSATVKPVYLHSVLVDTENTEGLSYLLKALQVSKKGLRDYIISASKTDDATTGLELCTQMQVADNNNIQLDTEDAYNFGLIKVSGVEHFTTIIPGLGTKTYVTIDLVWAHIGQAALADELQKLPEIRFTVSHFDAGAFGTVDGETSLNEETLTQTYEATFNEALTELLHKVAIRYQRKIDRKIQNRQYVTVATPAIGQQVVDEIRLYFEPDMADRIISKLPQWTAAHIEDRLVLGMQHDSRFASVAVVPNIDAGKDLLRLWNDFTFDAKNNTKRSEYAANDSSLNQRPELRRVIPVCDWNPMQEHKVGGGIAVPGFEVRSKLAEFKIEKDIKVNRVVTSYNMSKTLLTDVKIPLTYKKSIRVVTGKKGRKLKTLVTLTSQSRPKPNDMPLQLWVGPEWLGLTLARVVQDAGDGVVERLALSIPHGSARAMATFNESCVEGI